MKRKLDMDRIAEGLGAERRGKVSATSGYFGAMQLLADVEAKFRVPAGGGRPTDPRGTERRLVPGPVTNPPSAAEPKSADQSSAKWVSLLGGHDAAAGKQ